MFTTVLKVKSTIPLALVAIQNIALVTSIYTEKVVKKIQEKGKNRINSIKEFRVLIWKKAETPQ
jgi:hypothetical protein